MNHAIRDHALLTPSSAHRWLKCTKAPRFEEQFPRTESEFAKEGTTAHEVCEAILRKKDQEVKDIAGVTDDMKMYANHYNSYIQEIANTYKDPLIEIETRLDLSDYIPESFGTADCIIIGDNDLHVIDYKYGLGVEVSALNNPQMMIYALGALSKYGWMYEGITKVHMHIFQPRMHNICESSMSVIQLKEWGESVLVRKAKEAFNGEGEYRVGEWCRFCRGGGACKKRLTEEMNRFKDMDENPKDNIADGATIAQWLDNSDRISETLNAVREHALTIAMSERGSVPGYKVVRKRTLRRWQKEEEFVEMLRGKGISDSTFYNMKLKGITELERYLAQFNINCTPYIYKPEGAPEIVPIDDKREEMVSDEQRFSNQ